jgi:hypothetical protein
MILTLIARVGARPAFGGRYRDVSSLEGLEYFWAARQTKQKCFELTG